MTSSTHLIWGTKNRLPILTPTIKHQVIEQILIMALEKDIKIHALDGHLDHLHALVERAPGQGIDWVARILKGGSSFWANNVAKMHPKLYWATKYHYVHVPVSAYVKVRMYIENQESHHRLRSYKDDYMELLASLGLKPR